MWWFGGVAWGHCVSSACNVRWRKREQDVVQVAIVWCSSTRNLTPRHNVMALDIYSFFFFAFLSRGGCE